MMFLSHIGVTNILCSIAACSLIAGSTSSGMHPMSNAMVYIYSSFIIRNLIHLLVLKQLTFVYNKFRLSFNMITCLVLVAMTGYLMERNHDYNVYHIVMIAMPSILLCCDLWMISSLTFQPNKLRNAWFEIDDGLLSDLHFVGKHSSDIGLDDIALCVDEMKRVYRSNITRPVSNRKVELMNLYKLLKRTRSRSWRRCERIWVDPSYWR